MLNSKKKGNNFERKVAHIICDYFNVLYEENPRTPLSGGAVRWKGDIQKSEELKKIFPFHIECKKREGWDLWDIVNEKSELMKWWQQCKSETPSDEMPLLVFSKNYCPIFCMFIWNKMLDNMSKYFCLRFLDRGIMMFLDFLEVVKEKVRKEV